VISRPALDSARHRGVAVPEIAVRDIVDQELARLFRQAVGLRLLLAPLLALLALLVAWVDPAPWRRALMLALGSMAVVASAVTERQARSQGVALSSVPRNLLVMALFQVAMVAGTGGVLSPLLPIMVPLAVVTAISLGRRRATVGVLGTQVAALCAMATGQVLGWLPDLPLQRLLAGAQPTDADMLAAAAVMVGLVVASGMLGTMLRARFEKMVGAALAAHDDQLRTWVAWSRDIELLGGEIAHELKNPLASIKGLSALVGRDLPGGKAAERMAVLQGEVARMQGILDEFLTFSRPLSPLSLELVEVVSLCQRVAALHEGVARGAGVVVVVEGNAVAVRVDARKLQQVLINLVQNALAAAPRGSTVRLAVRDAADAVEIAVQDEGPGLDPALRDRVFEAGVSGREGGGGLGLTIALGIVRQHGGELTLDSAPGGGTLACVRLPRVMPQEPAA